VRKRHLYSIAIIIVFSLLFSSCATTNNQNKKEIESLLIQGQNYIISELYTDAIASYKEVLVIESNNIEGLYGLARAYVLSGDLTRSAKVILTLSNIDTKKNYSLIKTYATLLYDSGETEKALTTFYNLYNTNPYDKELAIVLIDTYLENENFKKAYEIATNVYQYHYKDNDLIKKIADIAQKGDKPEKESWAILAK